MEILRNLLRVGNLEFSTNHRHSYLCQRALYPDTLDPHRSISYYPYRSLRSTYCKNIIQQIVFAFWFLVRITVDNAWLWKRLRLDQTHFTLGSKRIDKYSKLSHMGIESIIVAKNKICILITWLYVMDLLCTLLLVLFSLRRLVFKALKGILL